MNKPVELLSPAGNTESVRAALANGADAIYLGAASFGARAGAGFDEESLKEAIRLCHLYGRKAHITVNTLIREDELPDIRKTLGKLEQLHADALLVQDIGLLTLIREEFPCFEIHLSTQMALHNALGAEFARSVGADRIVLARECDLDTIRKTANTGIDTEVFVHGALCVCVSGQCYLSSSIGGRSGNRGRCAQPCRLEYDYLGKKGSWLSPKDICTRDHLPELINTGVRSLKIEGRLKRPEYVAYVTRVYREAIDSVYNGSFRIADSAEKQGLRQIFSRGSFTAGYAFGEQDAGVIYPERSSPAGILIGRADRVFRKGGQLFCEMTPLLPLHNGDGLEIDGQNITYSGPDIPKGNKAVLRLHTVCRTGCSILRQQDEEQLRTARESYDAKNLPAAMMIPFDAEVTAFPGKNISVLFRSGSVSVRENGPVCTEATSSPATEESLKKSVGKTGGTCFYLNKLTAFTSGAYAAASVINDLRRNGLIHLKEAIIGSNDPVIKKTVESPASADSVNNGHPLLFAQFTAAESAGKLLDSGADRLIFSPLDYRPAKLTEALDLIPPGAYVALPLVCSDEAAIRTAEMIRAHGFHPAIRNVSQLICCASDAQVISLEGVPVFNSRTIRFLKSRGVINQVLSNELSYEQISTLHPGPDQLMICYGRQRLMTLTHCPFRTSKGLSSGHSGCEMCSSGSGCRNTVIRDRMNAVHPLIPVRTDDGCRVDLMHDKVIQLSEKTDFVKRNAVSVLLNFTDETLEKQLLITHFWRSLLNDDALPPLGIAPFEGRYSEGVL